MEKALKVLRELEELGKERFLPSIGPVKGKIMIDIIKRYRPRRILEIGALMGYSSILMATYAPRDAKITTIEINERAAEITRENIERAGLSDRIEVIVGDALDIISGLREKFDFMFIDATKEEYFEYLKLAEKNLKKGSVVVSDNVGIFEQNMLNFLRYVRNSGNYKSETIKVPLEFSEGVDDAMEVSVKN